MRRLAPVVILFLLFVLPGVTQAQTCTPPVVIVVGGTNPACAGQTVTLDAGSGWTTYQWSLGGATTRMISDTPSATTSYWVTTTDANGCSVTSQPLTVVVNAAPAAPSIQLRETTLCDGGQGEATATGTWSSYAWSVTNGTIAGGSNGATVDYTASGAGPVGVSVTVTDSNGCAVTTNVDVPLHTIAKPTVQTMPDAICPGSFGDAWVNPPAEGSWQSYHWTVTNATIAQWSGDSSSSVGFTSSPSGQPVTVQVTVTDINGCTATSNPVTIPVRSIAKPTVQTMPDMICPGSFGDAWVNPPAEGSWQNYHWTVTNATIASWSGDSSSSVGFTSSPSGQPVTVQVTVTDSYGCTATSDPVTIPVRSIAKPTVQTMPNLICPGSFGDAWVNPPAEGSWQNYHWTVTNGTIASWSGDSSSSVGFTSSPSGQPVTVQVTVTDSYGCTATSDPVTIPVRSIAKPTVQTTPNLICPGSFGDAWVNPPAEGSWQNYHWTVLNGTIASWSGDSSSSVGFTSSPSGQPVIVQVTVTDSYGCTATSDPVTIPVRSIAKPTVQVTPDSISPGSVGNAWVNPPAEGGSWQSYHWTVTNATIASWSGDSSSSVGFTSSPSGQPVTVQVTVTDSYGCTATSDPVTIPVHVDQTLTIHPEQSTICVNGYGAATIDDAPPENPWTWINWTVENGTVVYGQGTTRVNFQADGSGNAVVVHVSAQNGSSSSAAEASVTLPTRIPTAPVMSLGGGSCPATASVTNASEYTQFQWSADNAELTSSEYNASVTFHARQNGHVTLTVVARDASGCETTGSVGYDASGLPDITMSLPGVPYCYGVPATASVPDGGPGVTYQWSMNSGQFLGSTTTPSINFIPQADTLALSVTATNAQGCSAGGTAYIMVNRPPVGDFNSVPASVCANGTATISTYANGVSYSWQVIDGDVVSGAGTNAITFRAHTAATVTVRLTKNGPNSCGATYERVIPVTAVNATVTATGPTAFCAGGSVTLTANSGVSYLWSNGATTPSITASASGNYSVTVTNANGCSATSASTTVTVNPTPTATITAGGPTTLCAGGNVTLTSSAGSSYSWSNGATTPSITVSASGSYSVTVTNANGCSATSTPTVVTANANPTASITAGGPTTFCAGGNVTLTASSATSYLWSNGATTQAITVNASGDYSVTVTDGNGCSATSTPATVTVSAPTASITYDGPTNFCEGSGSVTLTANEGASYLWNTGPTTRSIVVTQNGYYRVTVTDANGCSASYGTIITPRYAPQALIYASSTTACAGGEIQLQAGGSTGTYLWSTGATTQSIYATQSGNYSVTVTGTNGCVTTSQPVAIHIDPAPVLPVFSAPASICPSATSATVTVTNIASFSSIFYMSNATIVSSTNGVLQISRAANGGAFYVNAYGSTPEGCQYIGHVDVPQATGPDATITSLSTACAGTPTTASVPDAGPGATYQWEVTLGINVTGANTRTVSWTPYSFNNNPAQLYCVVTDASGCSTLAIKYVTVTPQPPAQISISPLPFCDFGNYTATTPDAGVGAQYHWTIGNGTVVSYPTANSITFYKSLGDGLPLYVDVTVIAASGCSNSAHATLNALPSSSVAITANGPTSFCNGGSVTLTATAGLASYLWSNGATTPSITVNTTGNYSVTGTSANGCRSTSQAVMVAATANPPTPIITASGPTTFCAGGSVTLTAPTTEFGYSYLWSTGATAQSIVVATSGNYSVRVTEIGGCSTISAPTAVTVNPNPTASITAGGPTTFCAGGSVTLTASSGSSWLWSNGATTQSTTVNASGNYSVTVTNANGCSTTSTPTTVTVNAPPTATITAGGATTFCAGGNVTLTASSGSGYLWSNGATTASITVSASGNYSVTVTNANGCSATSAATAVTVNPNPTATVTADGPTAFCAGGSVTLSASSGASYLWSNSATTQSITVSVGGSYSVTVTDANGCSATSTPTVVTANGNPPASITAGGPTTFCAGGSVTLTASSGASYLWSTGATTSSIAPSVSGSYSVTITDANGCSTTSSPTVVTVNANPTATITAGGPTTFCAGGSVTLTASSATSYLWSNGATTQSITANVSGNYSVTVTNANGCSATSAPTAVTVNANPVATITAGGPTTFCAGGSVTLTASSATSYLWSNGATTQSITANTSGNYSVTVTNANGCSATSSPTSVTVNANPTATITAGGPTTFCAGGSVTLNASSATSYLWSNGATTQSIAANTSGNYSVTVTNANGCSATSSPTSVTVNANPTATITAGGPTTFCAGGSVTLTASSGASYLWSNGATTQSITANASGNYSVTVTNANGCSATSSPTSVTVNANPTATISAGGPTTFCAGGSVILTASSGASYLWSNGATTQSISANTSGSYSVTVTNGSGCSATSAATAVTVNASPTASITPAGSAAFCEGDSLTLTASSGSSYLWSNGATTQAIHVTAGGSYSVTVTNANGCSATSSPTTITVNPAPAAVITPSGPTTFCPGGSVTLTASSGSSYAWSNGATTQSITVNASGSYRVTVTNANFCSATSPLTTVTLNSNPTVYISAGGPTTFCAGGSLTLTASSGASYLWSNGATTQVISATTSGNYTVTVTDANGCSATSTPLSVTVNPNPSATITAGGPTTFCAGGSVTLTASSGSSYFWSNGATTQSIVASTSGSYSVIVNQSTGCSSTSAATTVTVNANPTATITASGPTTYCIGGSVTLTASSGASYWWSNGQTTPSITISDSFSYSGSYSVTVTNANGCSATSSPMTVTSLAGPTPGISSIGPTTFCAGGSVTLTASGGTSYLWSTGATTPSISVSSSGNYSATVTDANGCSATTASVPVTVNPNPTATITAGGPTNFCAGGSVTLTASSGSSYLWSNGATTPSITVSASNNYSVTVTNANGCNSTSAATTVTVNAAPTATITTGGPTTFCAGGNVTLTASSGTAYLWSNGATTQSISASTSGSYSVTVTNANGCSATSAPTTVTVNANPTATITAGGPTTFCAGGSVTLTASSGSSYHWSNGATTPSITVSASNNYSVTVTNANGCSATSAPTTVTVRPLPTSVVSGGGAICPGGSTTITATLTGTAPWSVKWSDNVIQTINSGTTATRSVSPASGTTYTVILLSDANCTGTSSGSAVVTVKTLPTAVVSGGGTICPGGSATITAALTGTAPWSVTWSDGNIQTINSGTTATRSVSPASTTIYTVTSVSDAASCPRAGSGSATVTRNTAASITTQPSNATTTRNTNVTLSVVAAGTSPISYQWFKGNGTSISGATSSSYTTSFPNKGTNTFYVEVWNSCNTTHVRSNTVTITVN